MLIWQVGSQGKNKILPILNSHDPGRLATQVMYCTSTLWNLTCTLPQECNVRDSSQGRKFVLLTRVWDVLWGKQTTPLHAPNQSYLKTKRSVMRGPEERTKMERYATENCLANCSTPLLAYRSQATMRLHHSLLHHFLVRNWIAQLKVRQICNTSFWLNLPI